MNCEQLRRVFRSLARPWALVVALIAAVACGAQTADPGSDGQSHWLSTCTSDTACGDGLQCLCGLCTRTCSAESTCDGLDARAVCAEGASSCTRPNNTLEQSICSVSCTRDAECPAQGSCLDGACVHTDRAPADVSQQPLDCSGADAATCPPPPVDWCDERDAQSPLPAELTAYWDTFCKADAG